MRSLFRQVVIVLSVVCPGALCAAAEFEWVTATPESQGMSSQKLEALRGDLAARRTTGLLIIRNDKIVCEWYAPGQSAASKHGTASMAKAIVGGVSLAVAMTDGRIALDDPAAKFIPQWRNDPRKSRITVRQLGSHTSGIEDAEADNLPHEKLTGWKGDFWKRLEPPRDPFTLARDAAPALFDPGTKMQYSNPGIAMLTYAVTASLRNAPHKDIRTLLRERVMRPLGVPDGEWSIGYGQTPVVDGLPLVGSWGGGAYTARAVARIGRLMLREGDWDGPRIISRDAVRQVTRDVGTPGNCGIGWWSNNEGECAKMPRDAFWGSGAGHQIVLVVPSLSLIAVRNGELLASPAGFEPSQYHEPVYRYLFEPLVDALTAGNRPIDRHALVTRHNVTLTKPDPLTPLTVGNGEFAFTADVTGLQTFPDYYEQGVPLCTESQWGWHESKNAVWLKLSDALEEYEVAGRKVPYASGGQPSGGYSPVASLLRANPHRLHLGRIGLQLTKADGSAVKIGDLANISQTLDLWSGLLTSRFEVEGSSVAVSTVCHPKGDTLAVRIESPLLEQGRLSVLLAFPYGSDDWHKAADWDHPDRHTTQCRVSENHADFARGLNGTSYNAYAAWSAGGEMRTRSAHEFEIRSKVGGPLEIEFAFSPITTVWGRARPDFLTVRAAAAAHWSQFWMNGGAIDFSACTDPRAGELERRVVLSQYLTAIQCAGSMPPQETGLTFNSWYGKFHLEMHWWHGVHFALWNRLELLERSLPWYERVLRGAKATAARQGYDGARWPKMVGPDGRESPSNVGVFLIWQQPHPIYYAELCYRAHPDRATLERYQKTVFETAEFMASYPMWDEANHRYVLGPAMIPAQESYGSSKASNLNPTFELAYWYWGLETAQKWRQRLGMDRQPKWDAVIRGLSHPNIRDDVYTGIETPPYTISRDHPSMLMALGFVPPTPLIDPNVMKRTYDRVVQTWDWSSTWGWDYPMMAMTAARLGEPEKAVDALFMDSPKNRWLANGHNYQSARLPLYLPGNGGLLTAVAMMAAGWDGCPDRPAPGFPDNGKWNIRWEGLRRLP